MPDEKKPETQTQLSTQPIAMSLETVQGFEGLQRAARLFASSDLVPKQYQGNIANCTIALAIAMRMRADPLMVFQNLNIIHGKPGWSSAFLIAAVNQSGRFTPLRFTFTGQKGMDSYGCFASAKDLKSGETLEGTEITLRMAAQEGWGAKWKTMPEQMLRYRAASFWARSYAPEVTMGFQTQDEVEDTYGPPPAREVVVSPPVLPPPVVEKQVLHGEPEVIRPPANAVPIPEGFPPSPDTALVQRVEEVEPEAPKKRHPKKASESIKEKIAEMRARVEQTLPPVDAGQQELLPPPAVDREPGEDG